MENNYIPKNLEEGIEYLNNELSQEDKDYLIENGAISVHHSLGTWIRNNWNLWNDESEIRKNISKLGYTHPDDMSNYIIEEFIKYTFYSIIADKCR